jgi:putative MATE family efflux protein
MGTMKKMNQTMDMVHGPLLKNIFIFALPLMAANLLEIAFNAADTITVGKFSGQEALAAVGAVGPIVNLMVALFNGLAVGSNIVIARQLGSGQKEKISASVHTSYFLALTGGILLTVLGFFGSVLFLDFMGTPADIISQSTLYLRIYFVGSIPLLVYNFGSAVLRSKGDTAHPTLYLAIGGVLNVILNLYFVICLQMSVAGVAIATVISESVSAVMVTVQLMKESGSIHLDLKKIRMDPAIASSIMKIGIPAGLQTMMWSISNVAVQSAINSFGSTAVAGNSAAANIEGFVYIGMGAFSQACITFTSQCAGAGEKERIKKIFWVLTVLMIVSSWSVGALAWGFGRFFLSLFTNDSAVIDMGMIRMWHVVFWLWLNGVLDIPASSLRGMGYSATPTVAMLLGIVGVRLLYIATIWKLNPTLDVLYMCFPLSWVITCVILFLLWKYFYRQFCEKY